MREQRRQQRRKRRRQRQHDNYPEAKAATTRTTDDGALTQLRNYATTQQRIEGPTSDGEDSEDAHTTIEVAPNGRQTTTTDDGFGRSAPSATQRKVRRGQTAPQAPQSLPRQSRPESRHRGISSFIILYSHNIHNFTFSYLS